MCLFFSWPLRCCVQLSKGLPVAWTVLSLSSSFTAQHCRPCVLSLSISLMYTSVFCSFSHRHQETNRRLKNVSGKISLSCHCLLVLFFKQTFHLLRFQSWSDVTKASLNTCLFIHQVCLQIKQTM